MEVSGKEVGESEPDPDPGRAPMVLLPTRARTLYPALDPPCQSPRASVSESGLRDSDPNLSLPLVKIWGFAATRSREIDNSKVEVSGRVLDRQIIGRT